MRVSFLYIVKSLGRLCFRILFCLSLLSSCSALLLRLLLHSGFRLHTSKFRIDEDTSTVFADDDLLVHLDIQLTLWRNLVETTTAGITLHVDDTQSVAGTLADALEAGKQTRLDAGLQFLGLLLEIFLSLAGLLHDGIEFVALRLKVLLTLGERSLCVGEVVLALLHFLVGFADFLVAEFDLQCLELDLLGQRVVLAIVLHLVELSLVAVYAGLVLINLIALLCNGSAEVFNLGVDVFQDRVVCN